MNIVSKLTIRHLRQNKRRTLVTIIGVIISVAMITAVATLAVSFMDLLQRQTIADEGEWHVQYRDVNKEQLKAIKQDKETKALILSNDVGYAPLEGSQNYDKPYLFIKQYNETGFRQFPIELSSGRLPKAQGEVVISDAILDNAQVKYEIGDTLTIDVGERYATNEEMNSKPLQQSDSLQKENGDITEILKNQTEKTYTIVGTITRPKREPTWSPGYTVISYLDENMIGTGDTVQAMVVLKDVNKKLYTHAEKLAEENGINSEAINFNNGLLRYYGITNNDGLGMTLFNLSAIIMSVIIVGSVSLIYNAFAISVSERSRHLGMLSSVGATRRQKRNSVYFEGMVIGLISIPIGVISGLAGIGGTFLFINSILEGALGLTEKLSVTVTPLSILVACTVSILTIFISTYIPAKRASKVSAIDAIRQTMDVKLTRKAVKTSKIVRKLFGMEAEIGLKNLKRNKRRYQATVFSLVISIVLFLTVSFFTDNLKKSVDLSQEGVNYDIMINKGGQTSEQWESLVKKVISLDNVTDSSQVNELYLSSWIDEKAIADELENVEGNYLENGKYPYYINVHALDTASLQVYAKSVGVDYERLTDKNRLAAIIVDTIQYEDAEAGKYAETKAIKTETGKSLELHYFNTDTEKETHVVDVEIAALTDQFPMGVRPAGIGGLNIIISEQALTHFADTNPNDVDIQSYLYLKSTDPMATQQKIEDFKEVNIHMFNVYQMRQQEEQMIMMMSVFTYGFIILITAISIANIFNTISTSVSLRKREFAMLKSVGMTPKGFNKMINYESVFYGIKALLYGLPISIAVMYLIHRSLMNSFSYSFTLPWLSVVYVIAAVFMIVGAAMLYSGAKVKKENIIDALKQESI